ncbi:hypothetical protein [Streptomyces sp. NPDC051776]|uniref:hypothetical protein n=1 Tax=Streptomyces sp. NPDC051776 TaxID=3155414 RepID=UPI00341F6D65
MVVLTGAATWATAGRGIAVEAQRVLHTPCRSTPAEGVCAVLKSGIRIFFRGAPTLP